MVEESRLIKAAPGEALPLWLFLLLGMALRECLYPGINGAWGEQGLGGQC